MWKILPPYFLSVENKPHPHPFHLFKRGLHFGASKSAWQVICYPSASCFIGKRRITITMATRRQAKGTQAWLEAKVIRWHWALLIERETRARATCLCLCQ